MGALNTGSDFLGWNMAEGVMYRANLIWNTSTFNWEKATGSAGAGSVTVTNFPATQAVSGTVAVSNMVAQGLTDTQLRATPVPVSGSVTVSGTVAVSNMVAQGLTDTQLRATPVPVSGSVTVSGTVAVSNMVAQGLTDTQLRASPVPVSGSVSVSNFTDNGLTNAQLRASSVAVQTNAEFTDDYVTAPSKVFLVGGKGAGAYPRYYSLPLTRNGDKVVVDMGETNELLFLLLQKLEALYDLTLEKGN